MVYIDCRSKLKVQKTLLSVPTLDMRSPKASIDFELLKNTIYYRSKNKYLIKLLNILAVVGFPLKYIKRLC